MTNAQERAKVLTENLLHFIETASRRKLNFSTVINLESGATCSAQERIVVSIASALAQVEAETWENRRGELWSFIRSCMSQGGDILTDYNEGKYQGYEGYSSRLDAAARARVEEWLRQQAQRAKEGKR